MSEDVLTWFGRWYAQERALGNSDAHRGAIIEATEDYDDDPDLYPGGWMINIDVRRELAEGRMFAPVKIRRAKDDWLELSLDPSEDPDFSSGFQWGGSCGDMNLAEALNLFRDWIERDGDGLEPSE